MSELEGQQVLHPVDRDELVEDYVVRPEQVTRTITRRGGSLIESSLDTLTVIPTGPDAKARFVASWLRNKAQPVGTGTTVTVADLFCGAGGLSVGVAEAIRAAGLGESIELAADFNSDALSVFERNLGAKRFHDGPIELLVDGLPGDRLTPIERELRRQLDGLDLLVGGPPCQGHSDLNNHTRRSDPKNDLYFRMARFAEVVRPVHVIIENVPGVVRDKSKVVQRTIEHLTKLGYAVDSGVLGADEVGGAQRRRRHFTLASLAVTPDVGAVVRDFSGSPTTVDWAIEDLGLEPELGLFGTHSRHSPTNRARIKYLFDNDLFDLPDAERPDCHRLKPHSYKAVYGRMRGDAPAPTVTAGFGSTGQGRFVHPREPRTLTPHEAARLQGFPDWYDFSGIERRGSLQKLIGNAVPSMLGYAVSLSLLR